MSHPEDSPILGGAHSRGSVGSKCRCSIILLLLGHGLQAEYTSKQLAAHFILNLATFGS